MKYFVLVALLGNSASAKHHHHAHGLAQLSTPEESRKAWDETRNTSWAVVAEQQRFQAEHNAMVAKNFADDTAATDAKKAWVRNAYIRTTIGAPRAPGSTYPPKIFAQVSDPLGKANEAFVSGKSEAAGVVKAQEDFQKQHNDMVASNFDSDTAATDAKKNAIRKEYARTLTGANSFAHTSFAQLRDDEDKAEKKEEEKKEEKKDEKKDEVKATKAGPYGQADDARQRGKAIADKVIARQEKNETKAVDGIEKRFKQDTEETDDKKADIQKNHDRLMKEYTNNINEAMAGKKKPVHVDAAEKEDIDDKTEKEDKKKEAKKKAKKEKAAEEVTEVYIPEQDIFVTLY